MHDSHTHLTIEPLYNYREQALDNFVKNGGKYLLNTSNNIESSYKVIDIHKEFQNKYPKLIQNAIGIHPQEFKNHHFFSKEYEDVKKLINELREIHKKNKSCVYAIGECGLEYHDLMDRNDLEFSEEEKIIEIQKMAFREQIKLANDNKLPITIHARDEINSDYCIKEMREILITEGEMQTKGCMHCYAGGEKYLQDFLDMGLYIGFNAILTYKSGQNIRDTLAKTPLEKVLLETDAPFLPTDNVRKDKKRNINFGQPSDTLEIAQVVSEIKNTELEKVLDVTNQNYEKIFLA